MNDSRIVTDDDRITVTTGDDGDPKQMRTVLAKDVSSAAKAVALIQGHVFDQRVTIAKLKTRLRDQTHQTLITGDYFTEKVHETLTRLGVVPECLTLSNHPCEQNVGTCINDLLGKIERLEVIVNNLPKTVDGVQVVPGMKIWFIEDGQVRWDRANSFRCDSGVWYWTSWICDRRYGECWSTREAAEAAIKEQAETEDT